MARRPAAPAALRQVRSVLRETFGMARLRPGQATVIERVLRGQPTLAVMPTGAGKSLCYQLPALLLPGRTVVVSPLIALMKDQCESLRARGVAAVQVNSAVDSDEARAAEEAVADGSVRILMTTPERLADPAFLECLLAHPVSLLAVDEAHCISQWGHDFRPAFLEIAHLLPRLGKPVVLALTATATEEIAADVCTQLGIPPEGVVNTGGRARRRAGALHPAVPARRQGDPAVLHGRPLSRRRGGAGHRPGAARGAGGGARLDPALAAGPARPPARQAAGGAGPAAQGRHRPPGARRHTAAAEAAGRRRPHARADRGLRPQARPRPRGAGAHGVLRADRPVPLARAAGAPGRSGPLRALRALRQLPPHRGPRGGGGGPAAAGAQAGRGRGARGGRGRVRPRRPGGSQALWPRGGGRSQCDPGDGGVRRSQQAQLPAGVRPQGAGGQAGARTRVQAAA